MIFLGVILFICVSGLPVFLLPFVATLFLSCKWLLEKRSARLIAALWAKHAFAFLKVCVTYLGLVFLGLLLFGRGVVGVVFLCALLGLAWEISLFYQATKLVSGINPRQETYAQPG